jgi:hypothetical protein
MAPHARKRNARNRKSRKRQNRLLLVSDGNSWWFFCVEQQNWKWYPGEVGVGLGFASPNVVNNSCHPTTIRSGLLEMLNSLQASCLNRH